MITRSFEQEGHRDKARYLLDKALSSFRVDICIHTPVARALPLRIPPGRTEATDVVEIFNSPDGPIVLIERPENTTIVAPESIVLD